MKNYFAPLLALVIVAASVLSTRAQGTAFTYQGRLLDGANPASGLYDLRFALYNAATNGGQTAGFLTLAPTAVSNGLFTVTLDFGAATFDGSARWLEISVRSNGTGAAFAILVPRQPLTATPYAVTAGKVTGSVAAGQVSGALALAQLPGAVVTNNASGVNLNGSFSGNGAGVTNVNLALNSRGAITVNSNLFTLASLLAVGDRPYSVVAADVNGDGRSDLISANSSANTLSVLTNNGSGGFTLASSPAVGNNPVWVTAADVNGDGRTDLISANYGPSTLGGYALSVLTNDGSGGFTLASSPTVGSRPFSVTAADVNGDGRMDLISANLIADTLSVLTNNGRGGFTLSSSPTVGRNPYSVVAADVNGDGRMDLISANQLADTLSVLTNNGTGGFPLASSPGVGTSPQSVVAADVNGDGRMDLISANQSADTLSVLTNNGTGGFTLAATLAVGTSPRSVVAADVNGDGRMDLISANSGAASLSVLINNGSGGFTLASSLAVGNGPYSVTTADVNGDGRNDLIAANFYDNSLSVLVQNPPFDFLGTFSGSGGGLTSLNASNLASGTVADARLSANVALRNASQTFSGANAFSNAANSFTGNGAGLTSLHAANLASGIVADARLSANVALRNVSQTFTGTNIFNAAIGLGSAQPLARLEILSGGESNGDNDEKALALAYHGGGFRHWVRSRHNTVTNDNAIDFFVNTSATAGGSTAPGVGSALIMSLNGGKVGIGTANPGFTLEVNGSAGKPGGGAWSVASDVRLKKNIRPLGGALDKLLALHGVTFEYLDPEKIHELSGERMGLLAQEVENVFPDWVETAPDGYKRVTVRGLEALLIEGLRQLRQEKDTELQGVKRELAELKKLVRALAPKNAGE